MPLGMKPPCAVRRASPPAAPGQTPNTAAAPAARNSTMAITLIEANQNSASPYDRTESRLTNVKSAVSPRVNCHDWTAGHQTPKILAPATASSATTMIQKYQYIQPV